LFLFFVHRIAGFKLFQFFVHILPFSVLLCTYISLGLVFVPKLRFICRVPPSADEAHPNGNAVMRGLSKSDQKRYEHLRIENEMLQKQIDEVRRSIFRLF
ncbi:unnamed protein product, partial [Nippostrongylus brasiliensis]|uniref:Transposase n=1 Tax=Nippostrongylus brasiliensis TaxID=27835 RepID=A0A0N4YZQ5_NIPBR